MQQLITITMYVCMYVCMYQQHEIQSEINASTFLGLDSKCCF